MTFPQKYSASMMYIYLIAVVGDLKLPTYSYDYLLSNSPAEL